MHLTVSGRRRLFVLLLGIALAALLFAVVVTVLALPNSGTYLFIALGVLVLALAGELLLLVFGESKEFDEQGDWYEWEKEARGTDELVLRCASCKETFTLMDDGTRPLRHTCPHCGKAGVLRDAPAKTKAQGA